MTKKRSNKKSRNKYKVSGGVGGGRGGMGETNNKKTRPLGGRRRRNRSQNQEGGMKYRTMLEKESNIADMGLTLSEIIPRLFAGLYASWKARNSVVNVGQDYTYADIGGSLTHKGSNKFILKTRAGLEPMHITNVLNEYVRYTDWYVYELQPTDGEITAYKKMSDPKDGTRHDDTSVIQSVWQGKLTKDVWGGNIDAVKLSLEIINEQYHRPSELTRIDARFISPVAYSIITSTTLSRDGNVPNIKNASHTLLYTACRSPKVTPDMIIMLIRHGCNVNQPNGAVRFTEDRAPDWASGANLTPLWGLVKCILDISSSRALSPNWPEEKINNFKRCLAALLKSGANPNWRDDQALTISEWLQKTSKDVIVPPVFELNTMGQPSGETLLPGWTTTEKINGVQYYSHTGGGTTYQSPIKELKLSFKPTEIAAATAAATATAAAATAATAAAATAAAATATAVKAVAPAVEAPGKWHWQSDDGKEWRDFSPGVNAALEYAYKSRIPRITIVTKNPAPQPVKGSETVTWWFDMKNSMQINTTTFSARDIQRDPVATTKSFERDEFGGEITYWYLGDVKSDESVDIEKQYQANKIATSVKNDENTFNFATMTVKSKGAENVLTRVCFDPPWFTDVQGKALNFDTSKKPARQHIMTVDQFCAMLREPDGINEKLIIALTEKRLDGIVGEYSAITTEAPNGNTALYCACRSPKTTAYSIKRMVHDLNLDVNLPNSGNKSAPLHGLVQRLSDAKTKAAATTFSSEYDNIHAIMQFLVNEKKADNTLANTVHNGGTALKEFNLFKTDGGLSDDQQLTITALLTPPGVPKDALQRLVTSAYVPELQQLIKAKHNKHLKTYVDTVVSKSADLNSKIISAARDLKCTTVGDIEDAYGGVVEVPAGSKGASFTIVGPNIDALTAPISTLMDDSIVQVASQFNFLESTNFDYTEITEYPGDWTQGPRASMASLEALILRDAAIKPTTPYGELQPLGQQPIFDSFKPKWYRNGYLEPHKESNESKLKEAANLIRSTIRTLKILAQSSTPEYGKQCIQVFSAAPSYQSYRAPAEDSAGAQICETLVLAQYRSIAKLAVIKSIAEPSKPINLHLTAVGQGAFNNPPSLYDKFITAVWEIVKPFNVGVYMHVYGSDKDPYDRRVTALNDLFTTIGPSAKTASGELPKLDAAQFIAHK